MAVGAAVKTQLDLRMTQRLVMTPQLQQAIKLLQLSRLELQQLLMQELQDNPVLEEITPNDSDEDMEPGTEIASDAEPTEKPRDDWMDGMDAEPEPTDGGQSAGPSEEFPSYEERLARQPSLADHLSWQLQMASVSEQEKQIGALMIGNIDEDGYLRATLEEMSRDAQVAPQEAERVLRIIQQFDPPGVGARDLRECLLLQVQALGLAGTAVERIIQDHLADLEKKRYRLIARVLSLPAEKIEQCVAVIQRLEPKPGRPYGGTEHPEITPDLLVVSSPHGYRVVLLDEGWPRIQIGPYYRRVRGLRGAISDDTRHYLEQKFRAAEWLMKSIAQRNRTIVRVAESVMKFQREFLDRGTAYLKPLVLRQVAEDCGLHESTVSRATSNKYIQTPQGLFGLKFFFNASIPRIGGEGEELSSVAVRKIIQEMIQRENPGRPLRDQEIVEQLRLVKADIARRTVAKYRAELRIPPAGHRRRSA